MENVKEWLNDNGSGSGSGYGFGFGLSSFNGCDVFNVDGVETIITHIKDSFASGYVLNSDLTLEIGRESFVKNRNVDLSASYTVEEFISICEDYYGGHVIKQLKEKLGEII